jgi:hypothetical protein
MLPPSIRCSLSGDGEDELSRNGKSGKSQVGRSVASRRGSNASARSRSAGAGAASAVSSEVVSANTNRRPTQQVGAGTTEAASRALLRLKQKLQGLEDPTSGEAMSVQGQVQLLLNEATDAENLCMLYHGWAPWL